MMRGISFFAASALKRRSSLSVSTFEVGFVGRETQSAAMSSLTRTASKST